MYKRQGQNLNALGDGGSQKAGHALRNDMLCPVTQTFLVCIVGVKPVSYTHLDVYKRQLFERITDPALTVRRITLNANRVMPDEGIYQVDFFKMCIRDSR